MHPFAAAPGGSLIEARAAGIPLQMEELVSCDGGTGYPQLSSCSHAASGCYAAPAACDPSVHLQDGAAGSDTDEMESEEGNLDGRSDTEGEGDEKSEDDGLEEEPSDEGTASSSTSTGAHGLRSDVAATAVGGEEKEAEREGEGEEEVEEEDGVEEEEDKAAAEEEWEEVAQQPTAKAVTPGAAVCVVT